MFFAVNVCLFYLCISMCLTMISFVLRLINIFTNRTSIDAKSVDVCFLLCSPLTQFELLHSKFYHCSQSTRQLLLSTYVKFINLFHEIKPQIIEVSEH